MLRAALSLCIILFVVSTSFGQPSRVRRILDDIEQNNPQLKAYQSLVEGRSSELRASNGLPDFQMLGYYMPFGEHIGPDYFEIEVAQSFDFPSVYAARKNLIDLQQDELMIEYDQRRQDVLLPAKQYCYELIYLNKRRSAMANRVRQAEQVMEQTHRLLEEEQVSIIELNKAKVSWLQLKYSLDQLDNERAVVITRLQQLNGGQSIMLEDTTYEVGQGVEPFDVLWRQHQASDPALRALSQKELVAAQQLTVARRSTLPGIMAGYNAQGFRGEYYAGFLAGVSLPLWKTGAKVNAAKALTDYQHRYTTAALLEAQGNLREAYQKYEILLTGLQEYRGTFAELNNEVYLRRAYEQGELSFIEYYQEAQFFWEAYDDMLTMERDLYQLQAELTKHRL